MPPPPGAPVVRLRLTDRDLQVARGDLLVEPDRRPAGRDADEGVGVRVLWVVLVEGPAVRLHAGEVGGADLLLHVRLGHGKDLAVRAHDADVGDAGRLDRVEYRRQELRRGSGAELVVDHDRDALLPLEELRERRAVERLGECTPCSLRRVTHRRRLVRVDRGDEVGGRDVEGQRVAMLLGLVIGCTDRQGVHRLVRDHGVVGVAHAALQECRLRRPRG